jgi:hypothetical protein
MSWIIYALFIGQILYANQVDDSYASPAGVPLFAPPVGEEIWAAAH